MARVLVIDDHDDHCQALMRLLRQSGHEAWCLTTVEPAMRFMAEQPIDLLIVDLMIPGISGMDVLTMLRKTKSSRELPIVIFSAFNDPAMIRAAIDKGADDYWVKAEFDFSQL